MTLIPLSGIATEGLWTEGHPFFISLKGERGEERRVLVGGSSGREVDRMRTGGIKGGWGYELWEGSRNSGRKRVTKLEIEKNYKR